MDKPQLRIASPQRDPRFQRETSASELQVKMDMDRRLATYFARKHGTAWRWCPACRAWGDAHEHSAFMSR